MKKIVIAWPGFTGYMGPCFKALSEGCDLRVFVEPSVHEQLFDARTMSGLAFRRVEGDRIPGAVESVRTFAPDLTLICGWRTPLARALARARLPGRKVLVFDMPWEWTLRKFVARWALWPRLRPFDAAFVPGRRCARYARWLGFAGARLALGANPSGWERFARGPAEDIRERGRTGRFLFAGRFVRDKAIDTLVAAYARYRASVGDPWGLDLIGSGEGLPAELPEGVVVRGFVPPDDMPRVMRTCDCLVLPSRWEPWGVVAAEAMSAGRLTILSDRCGLVDDIRPTCVVRHDSVDSLAAAMRRVAALSADERQAEARRVASGVERYSAANWARRVLDMAERAGSAWPKAGVTR